PLGVYRNHRSAPSLTWGPGRRERTPRPAGAVGAAEGAHRVGDRPPPGDRQARRPGGGHPRRAHRGDRRPQRIDRERRRDLPRARRSSAVRRSRRLIRPGPPARWGSAAEDAAARCIIPAREVPHVAPRADPAADARDRAPGPQSVDGPHGRGGGLPGGLSRGRRDRLPEGRARGEPQRDRDVPGRRRHRRRLVAAAERLGGPLMYLAGRGGLAGLGLTLADLGGLGYKIVADPSTPLLAAYAAWKKVYAELADGFGATVKTKP